MRSALFLVWLSLFMVVACITVMVLDFFLWSKPLQGIGMIACGIANTEFLFMNRDSYRRMKRAKEDQNVPQP